MKSLTTLAAFLFLAMWTAASKAEENRCDTWLQTNDCKAVTVKDGDTILFYPGTYDDAHPPTLAPQDMQCLVKMLEAMKAIDPYLRKTNDLLIEASVSQSPVRHMKEDADSMNSKDQAITQFRRTMKECVW